MKSNMYKKMLRLVATEVFLQLGFERATEQSLNIGTDLLSYYLEALVKRMVPFRGAGTRTIVDMLVSDFYRNRQYEKEELLQFLEQQALVRRQSKEKTEGDPLQLNVLKTLPQEVSFRNTFQNINMLAIEEKNRPKVTEEIIIDDFLAGFVEKCSAETVHRAVVDFSFDTSNILEEVYSGAQPKDEGPFCVQPDILAIQEFFLEDFSEKEKYKTFKP